MTKTTPVSYRRIGNAPVEVHEEAYRQGWLHHNKDIKDLTEKQINDCYDVAWGTYNSRRGF